MVQKIYTHEYQHGISKQIIQVINQLENNSDIQTDKQKLA